MAGMPLLRTVLFYCIGLGLSGLFTLLLLEGALRFFPVSSPLFSMPVTAESPIARFMPGRDFVFSKEWDFAIVNRGRVNNDGFVNNQDYNAADSRPLMAVIGDSYVEALMVPYEDTLHGWLAGAYPKRRVYSFAASGAPLSQYLIWARYAAQTYRPSLMAFVIVGNDYDESLPRYAAHQTFHQFVPGADGALAPALLHEYRPGALRSILRHSYLARYMFYNLSVSVAYQKLKNTMLKKKTQGAERAYVGNVAVQASEEKIADSKIAVDTFLRLLPGYAGLPAEKIILIFDGNRQKIYTPQAFADSSLSYFEIMTEYMTLKAQHAGMQVIDMNGIFAQHYDAHGRRFEFEKDWHWNALGHGLAAEALASTPAFKGFAAP